MRADYKMRKDGDAITRDRGETTVEKDMTRIDEAIRTEGEGRQRVAERTLLEGEKKTNNQNETLPDEDKKMVGSVYPSSGPMVKRWADAAAITTTTIRGSKGKVIRRKTPGMGIWSVIRLWLQIWFHQWQE